MKLSELKSLGEVEVGKSYSMNDGSATLSKAHSKESSSIGFKTITPENSEPFQRRIGCYTSLHIVFDEIGGRGGHRESFYFDMDADGFVGAIKKIKHIFRNCDSEGAGKVNLIESINFDFLAPFIDPATNQQVVVESNEELSALANSTDKLIMFERFGEPVETDKVDRNGNVVAYQRKRIFEIDKAKMCNVVDTIANAISNNLVGSDYYLKFDKKGNCEIKADTI